MKSSKKLKKPEVKVDTDSIGRPILFRKGARTLKPRPIKPKRYHRKTTLTSRGRAGRKPIEVDLTLVRRLARIHCSPQEIAEILNISSTNLLKNEEFRSVYNRNVAKGKMSIRRKQYLLALDGSERMLIWLGKQWLGQKDSYTQELSGPNGGPIQQDIIRPDFSKLPLERLELLREICMEAATLNKIKVLDITPRLLGKGKE